MLARVVTRGISICSAFLFATLAGLPANARILAQEPANDKPAPQSISVTDLSLEVSSLQALSNLQLDKDQLEKVLSWSVTTGNTVQSRKEAKVSKEYRNKLVELCSALKAAVDTDQIAKLKDELDKLQEKENPTLDDQVLITSSARDRVAEAYRLLKPSQMASYVGQIADSIEDPVDTLLAAVQEARSMDDAEWKELRDFYAKEIYLVVAGPQNAEANPVPEQIADFLDRGRRIAKADLEKQSDGLKAAATKIIGPVSAEVVLRNRVQLDVAKLLSNPRTPQACRALIKAADKAVDESPSKPVPNQR
jgi:hypothetical protein